MMAIALPMDALVVDDERVNRLVAGKMLAKLGFTVAEAESGAAALDLLDTRRVSLVLLDISMPGLSGEDVCRAIRERWGREIKVVAYTAHSMPEEKKRFQECGFDNLLVKPINIGRLAAALSEIGIDCGSA